MVIITDFFPQLTPDYVLSVGNSNIKRYYSVRRDRRTSGTVTTGNHFSAWAALGMNLGKFDYQILYVLTYCPQHELTTVMQRGGRILFEWYREH
jgi:hypothetical protein